MLLLTLLIALASPQDEGDPMRYVTHLVNPSTELQSAVDALVNAPPTDDLAVELASIRAVLEQVRKQREHIENAPAFRGDDALRTAMLADMTATLRLLETTLPEAARLARDPDPTNAELSAAGEAWLRMDAGLQRQRQARQDALAAFGEKHGLHLEMVVRERRSPYPAFEAEGLPPEGVQAPLQVYMALTAGYSNAHIVPVNRLHPAAVTAYRTLSTQDPDTIRQLLIEQVTGSVRDGAPYRLRGAERGGAARRRLERGRADVRARPPVPRIRHDRDGRPGGGRGPAAPSPSRTGRSGHQ